MRVLYQVFWKSPQSNFSNVVEENYSRILKGAIRAILGVASGMLSPQRRISSENDIVLLAKLVKFRLCEPSLINYESKKYTGGSQSDLRQEESLLS